MTFKIFEFKLNNFKQISISTYLNGNVVRTKIDLLSARQKLPTKCSFKQMTSKFRYNVFAGCDGCCICKWSPCAVICIRKKKCDSFITIRKLSLLAFNSDDRRWLRRSNYIKYSHWIEKVWKMNEICWALSVECWMCDVRCALMHDILDFQEN